MRLMTPLCELALKYDTDKCPHWHDGTGHSYTPFYHELLKDRKIERMLEIGICSNSTCGSGPSLRMWTDYFPKAQIYGIDSCPWVMLNENRIHSFFYDQSREPEWNRFTKWAPSFDLIIDDGSHLVADQILSANKLYPCLWVGGLYIIEDVQEGDKDRLQERIKHPSRIFELEVSRRSDDRLLIMERTT